MYTVDERDRVVPLSSVPQSSVGAPMPLVLADEFTVLVAYLVETYEKWDVPPVTPLPDGEEMAIVRFHRAHGHLFGPPSNETFSSHHLASRGLQPYGAFVVEDSSWIRALERSNAVHPRHDPNRFARRRHYVFTFHDSTFECVAEDFDVRPFSGLAQSVIPVMASLLARGAA